MPDLHPSLQRISKALRTVANACAAAGLMFLASCGGGDGRTSQTPHAISEAGDRARLMTINPSNWVSIPAPADPLLQGLTIPSDAPIKGMWSATQSWPLNGLHVIVLPTGKLLSFGTTLDGGAQNGRYFDVWDPSQGFTSASHVTTYRAEQQDSFCATATYLMDGRLMISGGNGGVTTNLYDAAANSVAVANARLADERWYATLLTLPDGRPLMLGGMVPYAEGMQDNPDQAVSQGLASMTPEIHEGDGWRSLFNAYSREAFGPDYLRASYPRAWVMPNGKVFGVSAEKMWTLDPAGNGTITILGAFKTAPNTTVKPNVGATNTAVMFDIGKVLIAGGNGSFNGDGLPASNMATVIDFNSGTPVLTEQPVMSNARRYANAVVLADGRVVITGGTKQGNSNGTNAVYAAEIWTPPSTVNGTGTWTVGAAAKVFRGYHSFSVLLPNGTVLSTGGGTPGPVTNLNAEVYYPPNLFRTVNGVAQLAPRPIMSAISGLSYTHGADVQIDMANGNPIAQLVLIGLGNGTHSFNGGQRRIPLTFRQDTIRLTAKLPDAAVAPPGYYQVVAVDAAGVPSRGTIVSIGMGMPPPVTTTPYNPPNVDAVIDAPVISSGGTARYSVVNEPGITYSWDFGDGSAPSTPSADSSVTHVYAQPGIYTVMLTAQGSDGATSRRSFLQAVAVSPTARKPASSSAVALEVRAGASTRLWVANPDTDTVAVLDTTTRTRVGEIAVGQSPRSVAVAPDGRVWVVNKAASTISIVNASNLTVAATVSLPRASKPHGLAFSPSGDFAYVVLEARGQLLKLNPSTGAQVSALSVGPTPRHLAVTADAATVLVSRFITPALPGEATAVVDTSTAGAEVLAVQASSMTLARTITLRHSDRTDTEIQGAGIPNYLAAAVISPDGASAWVPSKLDNIKRGKLRNNEPLDFQNTVRAVSSRLDLGNWTEDPARRIDHDNASLASAATFHPSGAYLFVALETSRQIAVINAFNGSELMRVDVGRAPQGLAVSGDGRTLYVQDFMDRTVRIVDLTPLVRLGELRVGEVTTVASQTTEKLTAQVLRGKQFFYDAKDPRLARDGYMSCAACHADGEHDGRVWDLSGFGEGLRNTVSLKGRAGMGHGFLHWSANFDEVQDFERQIRDLAGGTGLMTDAQYNTGTRSQPLGDRKAGVSSDLDALAAYVASLNTFEASPARNADGTLTPAAVAGRTVFQNANCASCHGGVAFSTSGDASLLKNIGTIKSGSGGRLGAMLSGIDVPTLRDVWATGPYLHDGSAATLGAAIQAHQGNTVTGTNLDNLVAYLQQIGSEESTAPTPVSNLAPNASLSATYTASGTSLPAIVNGITPANSADKTGGSWGSYRSTFYYGRTETVTFTWSAARKISGFEIYWWVDGQRYLAPTSVTLEYLNGSTWVKLTAPGMASNQFNAVNFNTVTTTKLRVSMKSGRAVGILEARVLGN